MGTKSGRKSTNLGGKWSARRSNGLVSAILSALSASVYPEPRRVRYLFLLFRFIAPDGRVPAARARIPRTASLLHGTLASGTPGCSPSAAWDASHAPSRQPKHIPPRIPTPPPPPSARSPTYHFPP